METKKNIKNKIEKNIENISNKYKKIFNIKEIENSKTLQWIFIYLTSIFLFSFYYFRFTAQYTIQSIKDNTYTCWPYFQDCYKLYFLENLPQGYSMGIFYAVLLGIIFYIYYLILKKRYTLAHFLLIILLLWKMFVVFVLTIDLRGNYEYYHIIFSIVFLFLPFKKFFLQLSFVLFYFLSTTIKIGDGWILGTYFSSLQLGLPIINDNLIPLFTNIVIFIEMIGVWFLFSTNKIIQKITMISLITFHLFSSIFVGFRFPMTVFPMLLLLFGNIKSKVNVPISKKSIIGWIFIILLFVLQSTSFLIQGNSQNTLEANKIGVYMFDANHQCYSSAKMFYGNDMVNEIKMESNSARYRCNPYRTLHNLKYICEDKQLTKLEWEFVHSVNGKPFRKIVDVENLCDLEYKSFTHNKWIKLENESEIVGIPVKNIYY